MHNQMKSKNCAIGIGGVMEEGGVKVGVIGQQVEDGCCIGFKWEYRKGNAS
jgi:hypothetical protein